LVFNCLYENIFVESGKIYFNNIYTLKTNYVLSSHKQNNIHFYSVFVSSMRKFTVQKN